MSTRLEREKKQLQNEHYKKVLAQLIAKEENKFCADCLAKGPRWVSWNLGVLLCIRCSGIHRSLGVHISRVKSVNLDTWTCEQLVSVCRRGNGWAKDKYEAKLPRDYKRPQSDSSMEYFIRDKYEKLKYSTSKEVLLRPIDEFNIYMKAASPNLKSSEKRKDVGNGIPIIRSVESSRNANQEAKPPIKNPAPPKQTPTPIVPKQKAPNNIMDDLLGLDVPINTPAPAPSLPEQTSQPSNDLPADLFSCMQSSDGTTFPSQNNNAGTEPSAVEANSGENANSTKQMSKDSILSLYSQNQSVNIQPNPYTNAGSYNMPGQNPISYPQQVPNIRFQQGINYSQQINVNQGAVGFPQQQQPMQGFQHQRHYSWQQQQMQQQMQQLQVGDVKRTMQYGGMRTCNSMPQMSPQQQGGFPSQMQQPGNAAMLAAPPHSNLTNSQPSLLSGSDAFGSWNNAAPQNSGQTLSTQLWK